MADERKSSIPEMAEYAKEEHEYPHTRMLINLFVSSRHTLYQAARGLTLGCNVHLMQIPVQWTTRLHTSR
jgi:hypothetical protein